MKLLLLLTLMASGVLAQTENKGTQFGAFFLNAGGSYYDIPSGTKLDKYGPDRINPMGLAFIGTLSNDKAGSLYFRKLSVDRVGDNKKLGTQTLFLYESPKVVIQNNKNIDFIINGKLLHYDQKNHYMYLKVEGGEGRLNQYQTYVMPQAGVCLDGDTHWNDISLSGFVQGSLAPVGFMNYQTKGSANLDYLDKKGTAFAFGGELVIEGMAKFKEHYYLKVRIEQNHLQSVNKDKSSVTNRISHIELGYLVHKNLSVNLVAENNELLFHNKDRHAIDVYNNIGIGLKYTLPVKKE